MTNLEWLETAKYAMDKRIEKDKDLVYQTILARTLLVIAEELIKLNSTYTDAKKMNHLEDLVRELDIRVCTLISKVRGDND